MWPARLFSKDYRCGRRRETRGTTSIYTGSLCGLPSFAVKASLSGVRHELISARFLRWYYFRLFQQYRSKGDQPTGPRLVRSPPESRHGQPIWTGQLRANNRRTQSWLSRAAWRQRGHLAVFPAVLHFSRRNGHASRSAVAILFRKRRTMLVVQHHRQPVQGLVAKTFRLDRLHRRQHIVAVDAGLAVALQHMA